MVERPSEPPRDRKRLGRYVLRYKIAQGGMASVYLAQLESSREITKWVAVKVIHPHMAEDRRFVAMFLDEARLISRIEHPNVCKMLDFGEEEGQLYLVLEYLHGESLQAVIHQAWAADGVPPWLAARVIADAARGLHAAHELRGPGHEPLRLVHRDVSPHNIMVLYDGVGKIMDFGVAHAEGRLAETRTGELKGKLRYMAPEQLTGGKLDRRIDVWALGVVLWETTTGQRLFAGRNEGEVVVRVMRDAVPRPSEIVEGYPAELERIVMAALARDPKRRLPTAKELADRLDGFLASAREPSGPGRVSQWMKQTLAESYARREVLLHERPEPGPDQSVPEITLEETGSTTRRDSTTAPQVRRARRKRWIAGGALVVGIGLVIGVVAGLSTAGSEPDDAEDVGPSARAPVRVDEEVADRGPQVWVGPVTASTAESDASGDRADAGTGVARSSTQRSTRRRPIATGTGTLNLLAVPPARVTWRGRSLGETPLLDVPLPAGTHTLTLRSVRDQRTSTVRVRIRPGRLTRRSVSLE